WEKDGITRYTTEVVGDNMTMLGSRSSGGNSGVSPESTQQSQETSTMSTQSDNSSVGSSMEEDSTDDLPF
ncbi:MAG: single-stranded DNA-binding protein, partial [Marinoscillum sp.]